MTDVIKMDYAKMEQMIQTIKQGSKQLHETMQQMRAVAKSVDDGALRGRGGDAFGAAINSKLLPSIQRLDAKFHELASDLEKAMQDMKSADAYSKQQFSN
jgi:WXG100 family type VII secretion target